METTVCAKCGNTGIIGNGPTSFNPKACDCGLTNPVKGPARKPTPYDGKRAEVGAEMTGSGECETHYRTWFSIKYIVFRIACKIIYSKWYFKIRAHDRLYLVCSRIYGWSNTYFKNQKS